MRILLGCALVLALAGTQASAAPRQDRDDDHSEHAHHDNGHHYGSIKHHHEDRDEDGDWDFDHDHVRPGHYYPYGRYEGRRGVFVAVSVDYPTRRVILNNRSTWIVASHDIGHCHDWRWDKDSVRVYVDDQHPGWYVLFNARLDQHVHVEYFGH